MKNDFQVRENTTLVPRDFRCYALDMAGGAFGGLCRNECTSVIIVESQSGWKIQRSGKSEAEHLDLFFIHSGSISIRSADGDICARKGQLLIVPSWYDREAWLDEPGCHTYVRFDNPRKHFGIERIEVRNTPAADAVSFFVRTLLVNNQTCPDEPVYRSNIAESLTILLMRELHSSMVKAPPEKTQSLIDLIQNADGAYLSVHCIAKKIGMSISAFRKFCLENFGKSPIMLINEIRMSRTKALLSYSNLSIDDIASQLGYADRFAFTKAFARHTAISPALFRKH